jgi:hypothetical protein
MHGQGMEMVKLFSKFYIDMQTICVGIGPGIPAHLSVTRILFEIDINQERNSKKMLATSIRREKEIKKRVVLQHNQRKKEKVDMKRRAALLLTLYGCQWRYREDGIQDTDERFRG